MKMLLLTVMEEKVEIVDAETLEDYYRLIKTDLIDIVTRSISGESY